MAEEVVISSGAGHGTRASTNCEKTALKQGRASSSWQLEHPHLQIFQVFGETNSCESGFAYRVVGMMQVQASLAMLWDPAWV